MRNLLLFVLAATVAVGCSQESVDELTNTPAVEGRSLVVSLDEEGDETRIQLNEDFKTVWNEGDLVSVFYRSTVNEQWQFQGKTGDRTGNILPVDSSIVPPATGNDIVVVYPYNDGYFYNSDTKSVQASLPSEQTYLKDSYGTNGNIMVSSSEYNQITLKSVCGWLKLQLTGNGEEIKSITVRGNSGEQLAGELYINTSDATSTLASQLTESDDDSEVSGTLVRPGTILTEVTLNCLDGSSPTEKGVALGAEATSFYIALPPQTFTKGITVEITDTTNFTMTQSTDKEVIIERNHIKPMAAFKFVNPNTPILPTPANNEIWYTATAKVEPYYTDEFGATYISNVWDSETGKGVITFEGDVTKIGYYAFYQCSSLTSVTIPDSVMTIGDYAFCACYKLTSVTIPDSATTIGEGAFFSCTNLTSVTIGNSVTTIGRSAFDCCINLTSVTIPDSVTTIGNGAFNNCESLTSVTIGDSVTTIGNEAFADCNSLKSVTIGNRVTTIGEYAFRSCWNLTSVTIPDSVTTIGDSAFAECVGLTSVTIPNSVTTIGKNAFYYCASLISVTIPDSVTTIGEEAFYSCDSLKTVYCKPTTPPSGGINMFDDNASERKIYVPASDDDSIINAYKEASGWSEYKDYIFEEGPANNEIWYTATAKVEPYNTDVFGVIYISTVWDSETGKGVITFSGDVTKIGNYAFGYCDSLTSVTIPDRVTTIGENAFASCDSLKEFKGKFAADGGRCLIIDGVLDAFAIGCGVTQYTIPDSVTTIGDYAFYRCNSLKSVTIGNSVKTIGLRAFSGCGSLTSVTIGNSVTTIGSAAFENCNSLESVTIPDSVTTIGKSAFYNCRSLKTVYCKRTTPPTGGSSMFSGNASDRKIYVPSASVSTYKAAKYWSDYANYIFEEE